MGNDIIHVIKPKLTSKGAILCNTVRRSWPYMLNQHTLSVTVFDIEN